MSYKRNTFLLCAIFLLSTLAYCSSNKHLPLMNKNEKVLISFKLVKSNKIATVSIAKRSEYIIYRFGKQNKTELVYPKELTASSWDKFQYSYYLRGGGPENAGLDLNYLTFTNGNFIYKIYEEYSAEDESTSVGILVRNNINQKEVNLKGDSMSIEGSLIALRDNDKVRKIEMEGE